MDEFTVLLTGSNGFLGKSLKIYLNEKNVKIETISIRTKLDIDKLIDKVNVSKNNYKIINAGWSGVTNGSLNKETQNVNFELQKYLFQISHLPNVIKFINFGSYNEYGDIEGVLTEDLINLKPISEYAIVKDLLRQHIDTIYNWKNFLHLRIANVFGPNQPINSLYGTLLNYSNSPLNFGAGNALRDMLYIDDFCHAIFLILFSNLNGILNIGSGESITNKKFIMLLSNMLKIPSNQLYFDQKKRDNTFMNDNFTLSIEKAKSLLGWNPAFIL
jgi:nucleoside-diphosphate-sugar epimerase